MKDKLVSMKLENRNESCRRPQRFDQTQSKFCCSSMCLGTPVVYQRSRNGLSYKKRPKCVMAEMNE